MKKLFNIIIILFFITTLTGCMKEFDNDPIGLVTKDMVKTDPTTSTIESAVRSSYGPLGTSLNAIVPNWRWDLGTVFRNDILLEDIASNDMNKKWNPDGDQAWMDELGHFTFTAQNQAFNGIWVYDYEGISRANLAIGFLTDDALIAKVGMSTAIRNQLLSEVYFLRAYYYFDLVNNFGDVPLLLKAPDSFDEALKVSVRATADSVKLQLNSDLSAAKAIATNVKYPSTDKWRVSKGAIISLQAKVALYAKDWTNVLSLITELDALGFYDLNPNYFDSFDATKEFTDLEDIFVYDHRPQETPNVGNGIGAVDGWGFWAPTTDFISAFETSDPRLLYTIDVTNKRSSKLCGSTTLYQGDDNGPGNKIYIRYADVLLWKAEALNETEDYPGAITVINKIRARARTSPTADGSVIPAGTLSDRPASTDKTTIKNWLMSERRVELGWESQRFNDLKRWGTAKDVLRTLGVDFQDYHYLYPIPQLDIDKSGGTITQNTGY